jgi:hypothetical protein
MHWQSHWCVNEGGTWYIAHQNYVQMGLPLISLCKHGMTWMMVRWVVIQWYDCEMGGHPMRWWRNGWVIQWNDGEMGGHPMEWWWNGLSSNGMMVIWTWWTCACNQSYMDIAWNIVNSNGSKIQVLSKIAIELSRHKLIK